MFYLIAKDQSPGVAKTLIQEILTFIHVADVTHATIETALTFPMTDFEDAVQLAAALQAKADYLVTRNIKDYPETRLAVLAPAELLTYLG